MSQVLEQQKKPQWLIRHIWLQNIWQVRENTTKQTWGTRKPQGTSRYTVDSFANSQKARNGKPLGTSFQLSHLWALNQGLLSDRRAVILRQDLGFSGADRKNHQNPTTWIVKKISVPSKFAWISQKIVQFKWTKENYTTQTTCRTYQ